MKTQTIDARSSRTDAQASSARGRAAGRIVCRLARRVSHLGFFHKRLCGPLANSRFHHRPTPSTSRPASSKPPTTAPTRPFNRSSICSPPELTATIVELFLSTILQGRI